MADVSADTYRCLIVPDPRLTVDSYVAAESTITQAGPKPGVPTPQNDTRMVLRASGTQTAGSALRIRAQRAGMPGPDGATFVWRNDGDANWRGWDPPTTLSGWEPVEWTTTSAWAQTHMVKLADDTVLVAGERTGAVYVARRTTAGAWSTQSVVSVSTAVEAVTPCMVVMPSGRVMLYYIDSTSSTAWIVAYYSDDDGATWALASDFCVPDYIDVSGTVSIQRMRAVVLADQVLMCLWIRDTAKTNQDVVMQWASSDGVMFRHLDTWSGATATTHAAYIDLAVSNGKAFLVYLCDDGTGVRPYVRTATNAYTLLSAQSATAAFQSGNSMRWGTVAAGAFTDGELAIAADEDGALYLLGRDFDAGALDECYTERSLDGGATWEMIGAGAATGYGAPWWNGADSAEYPVRLAAVAQRGRLIVAHSFTSGGSTADDSLLVAYLGGYTTVCLPAYVGYTVSEWRCSWETTWLPFSLPENLGATWGAPTVTGAAAHSLADGYVRITGGLGDAVEWDTSPTSTLAQGLLALAEFDADTGTAHLEMRVANATPVSYSARVSITANSITVDDITVGGTYTATTATTSSRVQILMAMGNSAGAPADDGSVRVWWRYADGDSDREWTLLGTSDTLKAGATASNRIAFGNRAGVAPDVGIRMVAFTYGDNTGFGTTRLYAGQANPGELLGRAFSTTPVSVDGGLRAQAVDGPAMAADTWHVDCDYEHPIRNVFADVAASPRVTWRTTEEGTQSIVLAYNATLNQETPQLNAPLAVAVFNANFPTLRVYGYDLGTAAYVLLGTLNLASGQTGLKFVREGDVLRPYTSGSAAAYYYPYAILDDAHVRLSGDPAVVRRVRTNSEGVWTATTTKRASLLLDGTQSTDSTGGAVPTMDVWSKDGVIVIHNPGAHTKIKLEIPATDTAEGYIEAGTVVVGTPIYLARQYSKGRTLATEANTELAVQRSGMRIPRNNGPNRRTVEFAWVEGVDTSGMYGASLAPDYVTGYTGGEPVGTTADTPHLVVGLAERLRGTETPIVYVPKMAKQPDGTTPQQIVNRHTFMLCRMESDPRLTNVLGDEHSNPGEVFTVASVRLSEEV